MESDCRVGKNPPFMLPRIELQASGLNATYARVRQEIRDAIALQDRLRARRDVDRLSAALAKRFETLMPAPLLGGMAGRTPEAQAAVRARAMPEDLEHPLFEVVNSTYFIEALADHIRRKFTLNPEQVEALALLHAEREKQQREILSFFRLRGVRTTAVTLAAVLATQLPKESFAFLGLSANAYGGYRLIVFAVLMFVVLYVLLASIAMSNAMRRSRAPAFSDLADWRRLSYVTRLVFTEYPLLERFNGSNSVSARSGFTAVPPSGE